MVVLVAMLAGVSELVALIALQLTGCRRRDAELARELREDRRQHE
jgi:hypothetical protein